MFEFNNENMGIVVAGYGNLRMVMLCYQKQFLKNERTWGRWQLAMETH